MKTIVELALEIAAQGIPVFPTCDKMPAWSNAELGVKKGEGGYKIATTDPDRVRELFSHPRAVEIAVPMGEQSGLLCIDVDSYKTQAAETWMLDNTEWLGHTRAHRTRSGGVHYFFKHDPDITLPSTLAEGVDVKASGNGYVCWPGTEGYEVVFPDAPILELPQDKIPDIVRGAPNVAGRPRNRWNSATDEELIQEVHEGRAFWPALRSLASRLPSRRQMGDPPLSADGMAQVLRAIMKDSLASEPGRVITPDGNDRHDDWSERMREGKIEDLCDWVLEQEKKQNLQFDADDPFMEYLAKSKPVADLQGWASPQAEKHKKRAPAQVVSLEERRAKKEDAPLDEYVVTTAQDLHARTLKPIDWIVPSFLARKGFSSTVGQSNIGKTRFMASLTASLAVGETRRIGLPAMRADAMASMWIANEEYVADIHRRLKAVYLQYEDKQSQPIVVRGVDHQRLSLVAWEDGEAVIQEERVDEIVVTARKHGVGFIVLDPYITLVRGGDENNQDVADALKIAVDEIREATGAAVMHLHHTPKDRTKAADWYRGDQHAWRGAGAIYSSLDAGFTLSPFLPVEKEERKRWVENYRTMKLKRFIVLDPAKLREGEEIEPVVFELIGQDMARGEGEAIGVCRLTDEAEAGQAVNQDNMEAILTQEMARLIIQTVGVGNTISSMQALHRDLRGAPGWPYELEKIQAKDFDDLDRRFAHPVMADGCVVTLKVTKGTRTTRRSMSVEGDPNAPTDLSDRSEPTDRKPMKRKGKKSNPKSVAK